MNRADEPMSSVSFQRVSKRRPCRTCGKPICCGFSRDEGTCICMRISAGCRGLSHNGGNIHVPADIPFIAIRRRIKSRNSLINSRKTASLKTAALISRGAGEIDRISPLSHYMEELVTGPGGLLSRGLLEHHATSYGALPANKTRARISRRDP